MSNRIYSRSRVILDAIVFGLLFVVAVFAVGVMP